MKVVCVIPARLNSKRFPRKVLSRLGSKPLLQWVWEAATACPIFNQVAFAVDHEETAHLVQSFQGEYFMTSETCPSGTDRLIELMDSGLLEGDIWVNWQGDEPFIDREMIDDLLQSVSDDTSDVWTLKKKLTDDAEVQSPHVVKVVTDLKGEALYFSRASIPFAREGNPTYYKHIGLYAYRTESLKQIQKMTFAPLEKAESLEQLRFMEGGLKIKVHETKRDTQGIDVPEDLLSALRKTAQFK